MPRCYIPNSFKTLHHNKEEIEIILIYNTNFNKKMMVTRSKFMTLEEWREQQLNKLI